MIETIVTASVSAIVAFGLLTRFALKEKIKNWIDEESAKRIEELRSNLVRTGADYEIYAQKRHAAIALLYAEMLEAEYLVGGTIKRPYSFGEKKRPEETAGIAVNKALDAYFVNALYLTEELSEGACRICDLIGELANAICDPSDTPARDRSVKRQELRQALESFLVNARRELSQSRPWIQYVST
jgi:hypothetical protein